MTLLVGALARVDGVQLIGEMVGSGYRTPPALVRRADGQTLQLTPLLYRLLEAVDGVRGPEDVAAEVSRTTGRHVTAENVQALVDGHLRPLGLVLLADGTAPALRRSNPLLGLHPRIAVTDPRTTRRVTDPFRFLFRPVVAAGVVVTFLGILWWVFFERGLGASAYEAFQRPHLLLLVFVVTVLSGGFHEFGHAAAARYSGAQPGAMGAGLYLVWPAFYTDVTDSYRLDRMGRVRTDLGGLYFNAVVVVLTFAWWYLSGWEALLLLVATQTLQMVQQLLPLLRFDGYHLLADLTGVPDLYRRMWPTLRGLMPHRWSDPENRILKPWARLVITLWVVVTLPMLGLMLAAVVGALPRLLGSAYAVVRDDTAQVGQAWGSGSPLDGFAHSFQALAVLLPTLGCLLILSRVGLRSLRGLAGWSHGSAARRGSAIGIVAVAVTVLSWAWWPGPGTYRPIGPDEEGLLTGLLPASASSQPASYGAGGPLARPAPQAIGMAAEQRLAGDAPLAATFATAGSVPTKEDPQLAMVLVPAAETDSQGPRVVDGGTVPGGQGTGGLPSDRNDEPWVFPFDKPLPPEAGDNQALAVNTADDSMVYDVAFALVWAEGDEVLNVNEAHAYASCDRCVTVAVAFQVVLILDDASVVVPQNLAVAANYECYRCVTAALASQLVLSVDGEPEQDELLALAAVWRDLLDFGRGITQYDLTQISAQLDAVKQEIVTILGTATSTSPSATETAAPSETATTSDPTTSPSPTESTSPTTTSTTSPSPTSESTTTEPTTSPTTEPTSEPTSEPTTDPSTETTSPSPSPTESPTSTTSSPTPTETVSPSATTSPSP